MLKIAIAAVCFGCWLPAPKPPEPEPAPICEGTVPRISAKTAAIISRKSGSVTFDLPDCQADYTFTGPKVAPVQYNGVSGSLTVAFNPAKVSLGDQDVLRLFLTSRPLNSAIFRMSRNRKRSSGAGLTSGLLLLSAGPAVGYVRLIFNQNLFETYHRYVLSWNSGTLRRVWVGKSAANIQADLGPALPQTISLWNVAHKYVRGGSDHLLTSMIEPPAGPALAPSGAFAYRESKANYLYRYGENVTGNANTNALWVGKKPLAWLINFPATNVDITN
jgi:hypothetical protein